MAKQKKKTKVEKYLNKVAKTIIPEGDVKTEKSCKTCHFSTATVVNENGWCKRHREYIRTLIRKHVVQETNPVCTLWHADLR